MSYIWSEVAAVPTANREAFLATARRIADLRKRHGATAATISWGVDIPDGQFTSFLKAVQCKEDETVAFSWVVWPSRAAYDEARTRMADEFATLIKDPPFDGKRLIFGSFETIHEV